MVFNFPSIVLFGEEHIFAMAENVFCNRLAVITSKGGTRLNNHIVQQFFSLLENRGVELVICKCAESNPTYENVREAIDAIKIKHCEKVLAIGGGSVIDVAKAAAYGFLNPLDFWEYINNPSLCTNNCLPIYVINTTAGTGSEINCCAVITKENKKMALVNDAIFPKVTWVVPELMNSLSLEKSIIQTLDSIYHATEAYLSINSNKFSRLCSTTCIELCLKGLNRLCSDGKNTEARSDLALASLYSGLADTYGGCLSIHSLGHAINAFNPSISHGMSITVLAPAYYKKMLAIGSFNVRERQRELCYIFNKHTGISETQSLGNLLSIFYHQLGLTNGGLSSLGFDDSDFKKIISNARETVGVLFGNDPVNLTDEMLMDILEQSR